jgi:hypothetical protein
MTEARIGELDIVTAAELADMIFPPVCYVVDGYIAEGLTILAGKAKIGKSWLALNFAIAVAAGGIAFGSIPVEAGETAHRADYARNGCARTFALGDQISSGWRGLD